jgi:hypothetical protein
MDVVASASSSTAVRRSFEGPTAPFWTIVGRRKTQDADNAALAGR